MTNTHFLQNLSGSSKKMMKNSLVIFLIIFFILGCRSHIPTLEERITIVQNILLNSNLKQTSIKTKNFDLWAYESSLEKCENRYTNIFIEGDGLAWITSSRISKDPTPLNPVGLKIFQQDKNKCKIYISRPCQYIKSNNCSKKYWTSHRFSKEVLRSYNEAIDSLKSKYKLRGFNLLGYSGGGAIATLLSAQREDIDILVTFAGNLDTDYWTTKHYITPLKYSLNPANYSNKLEKTKQYHLIGEKDTNIDKSIFDSYIKKFSDISKIQYKIIKNTTHSCCWHTQWKKLQEEIFP